MWQSKHCQSTNCDSNPQPWQQCSHLYLTKCALYINPLGYLMQCNESIQVMNICGEKRLADCNFRLYEPTQSSITACVTSGGLEALEKEVFQNLSKCSGTHFLHEADSWGSVIHFRWKFLITGRSICVTSLQALRSCKDATGLMQVHELPSVCERWIFSRCKVSGQPSYYSCYDYIYVSLFTWKTW